MITNYIGERLTPKQKAQEMLLDGIQVKLGYWLETETEGMTEREIVLVRDQMEKLALRLARMLGSDEVSHA